MRTLRVALAQVNPTVGDLTGNAGLIRRYLTDAERAGADVAIFPELCLTGYPPEDLVLKSSFVDANVRALRALAADVSDTAAVVGYVDRDRSRRLYNAAAVVHRGRIRGTYHKVCLPNYGVFDEKRYFREGQRFPLFELRGVRLAVSICEDAWVPKGPVHTLARLGAEVVANINASPYHRDKSTERIELLARRARESAVFLLYVQTVGGQDELVFDGDSLAFDQRGRLIARGTQFEEDLVLIDLDLPDRRRAAAPRARTTRLSSAPSGLPDRPALPQRLRHALDPIAEVYAALLLGTRDYVTKNGFANVVVGLSGGIDSSVTAVVAADALGPGNVLGVAMPSEYSSRESLEDAKELAANLGIGFTVIPIASVLRAYLATLAEPFAGLPPDVTEENLQARIRGNILMALSNKRGHLVLATGNKSEMATGYSTLYGDLAGGFAVLKDVPKTLVYELAAWRNNQGPAVVPARVIAKPPSAELRPGQLDTDSLPPYEELDPILAAYVEQDRSVPEIVALGFDALEVERVAALVDRSEYKRRQAPPGIKITHRAFGRDRRLPITNRHREPRTGSGPDDEGGR